MAAPVVVQSVFGARTTVGTTLALTWGVSTTAGNRLLCVIGANANQLTTNVVSISGSGASTWVLVNPPGKVIRVVTSNEAEDLWVYEIRNSTAQVGAKTITLDQSLYFCAALIEISGDDNTKAIDVQSSNTGSAQTFTSGTTGVTTVANSLAIAAFISGNKDLHSNVLPAGYSQLGSASSGGTAGTTKATLSVDTATLNATGTQSVSTDVAGGFNHSYAALIYTIPAPSGGGGGGGITPPTPWDDGKVYHGVTLDYFGAGLSLDTTAHSNMLATRSKAMVGWAVAERNDYGTFGPAMRATNPSLIMAHYNKSAVRNGTDPGNFPEVWYAHTCAGARVPSGSAGLDTMQPDGSISVGYADSRGFTVNTWRQWKAKDMWSDLDVYNAAHAATLSGGYLDSMYTASYKSTTCNAGTPYTKPVWVNLVRTIADAARTERSTTILLANGLGGGSVYYAANSSTSIPSSGLLDHVDMGLAEGWLRSNYDLYGTWPTLDIWQKCVNMLLDAQMVRGKMIWTISNVANDTSGSPPGNWVPYTAAQIAQWRRFCVCTHLLGQRGGAIMEFVSAAPGTKPWEETHVYYDQNLGAPAGGYSTSVLNDMAYGNGLYNRQYAAGAVVVNPTGSSLNYTVPAGKTYKNPDTNSTYTTGQTVQVAGHDGVMLIDTAGAGGGNASSPLVNITAPLNNAVYSATTPVVVTATATDADGIASVTMRLDSGAENTPTLAAGVYSYNFGILSPGAHSVFVKATDANASPLTVTIGNNITVLAAPPPNSPPTLTVSGPADVVVLPATVLAACSATDSDGIASVTASLDGAAAIALTALGSGNYNHDFGVLAEGGHTLTFQAKDTTGLSTKVVRNFLVQNAGGGTGGGTGGSTGGTTGTTVTISTDFADVALRIRERGL